MKNQDSNEVIAIRAFDSFNEQDYKNAIQYLYLILVNFRSSSLKIRIKIMRALFIINNFVNIFKTEQIIKSISFKN